MKGEITERGGREGGGRKEREGGEGGERGGEGGGERLVPCMLSSLQSITIPLQGFLNAIIYGWTREDFVKAIRTSPNNAGIVSAPPPAHSSLYEEPSSSVIYHTTRKVRGDSGIRTDTPHRDNTDTGILYTLSDNGDSD